MLSHLTQQHKHSQMLKNHEEKKLTYLPKLKKLKANAPPETGNFSTSAP